MYVASNLTFIAVGDFDPAAMKSLLASSLGRMGKGEPHGWKTAARPAGPSRLLLVNKPDATQTYFEIGHAGVDRKHPDRTAIQVVNTLFGGRFTSMLNDALRVNAGLTYGARSGFDNDRLTGAFRISSYTRTAATVQAIDMALDLLRKLREQGISAGQLQSAKAYLKGMYPTRTMETAGQLAGVLADIETFGLSRGEFDDYFARVDAVTLDQANAAAKKYFGSEPLRFVLLGNAGAIRDQVKKYAPEMAEIEVTAPGYPVAR
jgi:predicted Zn-dependent peptidase